MSDEMETRHYIGICEMGRMVAKLGPGTPDSFTLDRTAPMPMPDGSFMYPVSAEIADEYMSDEDADEIDEDEL